MGKGISRLQKSILRLLLDHGPLLRVRVILSQLFGWPGRPGDGQVFNRGVIGKEAYNSGHASLSRSLARLQERGLVETYKNATGYVTVIGLTTAGVAMARGIVEEDKNQRERP